MRRTKMVVAGGAMTAMLALSAGPAMADEVEFSEVDFSNDNHPVQWANWIEEFEFEDGELSIELVDGSDLDVEDIDFDFDSDDDSDFGSDDDSDSDFGSDNDSDFDSGSFNSG